MRHQVAKVEDFQPGDVRMVPGSEQPVAVMCTPKGEYRAVRSVCPHQGAELQLGLMTQLLRGDQVGEYIVDEDTTILRCPWHSFDFDVVTGRCIAAERIRVRTYEVEVVDGYVVVEV